MDLPTRSELIKALAEGRKETVAFQAQGLPDEVIMRIWEARAGLRWDETTQRHVTFKPLTDGG